MNITLKFDLHSSSFSTYRVYVNNELITERDYVCNQNEYIQAVIPLKLDRGEHRLDIINLHSSMNTNFSINNVRINNTKCKLTAGVFVI